MRLSQLEPEFLARDDDRRCHRVATLAEADGIKFKCPLCFQRNGGAVGTHSIICWQPHVPQTTHPTPGRWSFHGTGFGDLTLVAGSSSILLTAGCQWHGFITAGEIVGGLDAYPLVTEGTTMTDEAIALAETAAAAERATLVALLDNSVKGLTAILGLHGHSLPALRVLRDAELAGQNRVTAVAAIDGEIAFVTAAIDALTGGEGGAVVDDARDPLSFSRDSERADDLLDILAERPVRVVFGSEDRELLELKPVRTNPADWGRDGDRAVLRRAIDIDGESRKATVRTMAIVDDDDAVLGVCEIPGSGLIVGAGHKGRFAPLTLVF